MCGAYANWIAVSRLERGVCRWRNIGRKDTTLARRSRSERCKTGNEFLPSPFHVPFKTILSGYLEFSLSLSRWREYRRRILPVTILTGRIFLSSAERNVGLAHFRSTEDFVSRAEGGRERGKKFASSIKGEMADGGKRWFARAIIPAIHKYNGRADGEGGWKWMNPKTVERPKGRARGAGTRYYGGRSKPINHSVVVGPR